MKSQNLRVKEPTFDHPPTDSEITQAFNDYHYDFTDKDGLKFMLQYLKETNQENIAEIIKKSNHIFLSLTACWIARMLSRGIILPESSHKFLQNKIKEIVDRYNNEKKVKMNYNMIKNKTLQAKEKAFGTIDIIEKIIENNKFIDINIYNFLYEKSISDIISKYIWDYFSCLLEELICIKEDEAAAKAYSYLSREDIQDRINFYTKFLKDVETYRNFLSLQNKPRTEEKTIIPNFNDFKFLKSWNSISSELPQKIMGSKIVWTFNTKYNYLHCIRGNNLSIIRSRIEGEDLSISWARIVKKDFDEIYKMICDEIDPEIIREKIKNKTEYRPIVMCNEVTLILKTVK